MKMRMTALAAGLLCASVLAFVQVASAASEFKGNWTLAASDQAGMVRFGLMQRLNGGNMQSESDWPASVFTGLDLTARGKRDVQFNITRDAGRFDCEGYLNDGEGAGLFRFIPNAQYPAEMKALGFDGIDAEKQFAMAVHDVTVEFARQMKSQKLIGLDTEKLIAFRIFNVDAQFIRELRAEGLSTNKADGLIAFRVHKVTPAMVRDLRAAGFEPSEDQLIAMRVHGATPEFIADLRARGLQNLTIDQVISLRVHGID
jgi:hypothetical protein